MAGGMPHPFYRKCAPAGRFRVCLWMNCRRFVFYARVVGPASDTPEWSTIAKLDRARKISVSGWSGNRDLAPQRKPARAKSPTMTHWRKCLEATERSSLHTIYSYDFDRFRNITETTGRNLSNTSLVCILL